MNGKVVIGTELDTKSFDAQIAYLERKLKDLESTMGDESIAPKVGTQEYLEFQQELEKTKNKLTDLYAKKAKLENASTGGAFSKDEEEIKNLKSQIKELTEELKRLQKEQNDVNNESYDKADKEINELENGAKGTSESFSSIGGGLNKVIKKVSKWALAVFGIRSAYMAIRNAMNVIAGNDKQLQADIDYIKNIFAYSLEPIVRQIVEWAKQLLITLGTLIKQWTGKDIFGDADKKLKKANKQAKGLEKTLAGFDELNIIGNKENEGDVAPSFSLGDLDTSGDPFEWLRARWEDIVKWITEKWKELTNFFENTDWMSLGKNIYEGVKNWFLSIDWGGIADSLFEGLGAIAGGITAYVTGILSGVWNDIVAYFKPFIDGAGGHIIQGLLEGIGNAIANIGIWIDQHICRPFVEGFKKAFGIASPSKVMAELGGYIVDGFVGALSGIWGKVKTIIDNLKKNMVNAFKSIWAGIKEVFGTVGTFFKNTFTNAWTAVKNVFSTGGKVFDGIKEGIVNAFKSIVNKLIDGINKIISKPFEGINKVLDDIKKVNIFGAKPFNFISTINVPKIPHLARGGIVNNPGAGVMMGNYIAGEKGAEAVIPLTDDTLQRLANMISINIDMTNKLDSRVIGKQMISITNDKNFARNGG